MYMPAYNQVDAGSRQTGYKNIEPWSLLVHSDLANMAKAIPSRSFAASATPGTDTLSLNSQTSSHFADTHSTKSPNLGSQQWYSAAMMMGIVPSDTGQPTDEGNKLSRKLGKRRILTSKQLTETIGLTLIAVTRPYERLLITVENIFNREPIPHYTPRLDSTAKRRMGVLPPRPALTIGYKSHSFSNHQRELQRGLISDIDGAPRDLSKLSHVCQDTYWPFLVVEISDVSMSAASEHAIEATATCNNALMTLASALLDPVSVEADQHLIECVNKSIASFAIAIHRKQVRFITHYSDGFIAENVGIVQTYNLESERDVTALMVRIRNTCAWAEAVRLKAIYNLLDLLDRRVNFTACTRTQETAARGPMDMVGRLTLEDHVESADDNKKSSLFGKVIGSSMPSWSRVAI